MVASLSTTNYKRASVKIYHGYGHKHNLVVYGHVFKKKATVRNKLSGRIFPNIFDLLRFFFVKPFPCAKIQLHWRGQLIKGTAEKDGFFRIEWKSDTDITAGWHPVIVELLDKNDQPVKSGEGKVYVPHVTQYGFISDIDDTVLISHSASVLKRLIEISFNNPHTRGIFDDVAEHYELLSLAHTNADTPNPFFYVSSSEWNLYDYLGAFFRFNRLPDGAFLLNQIKRWFELLKTGKTEHQGKLLRIIRILEAFPRQQFVLLGDNSQMDPSIYATIAEKYQDRIFAVYIRNVRASREMATRKILVQLRRSGVHTCLFKESAAAIEHSLRIGLLENDMLVRGSH